MEIDILTKQDLIYFKNELLAEFKEILRSDPHRYPKWVRSADVRKMLGISSATLQNMRIQGHIPFTKIGGIMFYSLSDINRILAENKSDV